MNAVVKSKFRDLFLNFFDSEKIGGLLLVICTLISLLLANSSIGAAYIHFIHQKAALTLPGIHLDFTVEHWINDGLMAIFFLMVGLEVERELYAGELSSFRKAILPVAAAVGGMLLPALIHFSLNAGSPTQSGFAIPMATDIAFALGILALAGKRVPVSVKVFLTALAIIDDIGAIIVIALFYTKSLSFGYLFGALGIFAFLLLLNRLRVKRLLFYLLPGIAMWYCLQRSGVHATIAGVLLAFAIPFHPDDEHNISYRIQHALHKPVAFGIVPIFALANTAIVLPGDWLSGLTSANATGIMLGLILGKLVGIFCFPLLLVRLGVAALPDDLRWPHLVGIGLLGGIGFTMSMFISNLAFDHPDLVITSKLSILVGSSLAAVCGLTVFVWRRPVRQKLRSR